MTSENSFLPTVASSVCDVVGITPAVLLERLVKNTEGAEGRIVAKLDMLNPGMSKKDRAAKQIIEDATASGELKPGQPVVELTSGNMGTGLAIVCGIKGHPFIAVMSKGNSTERKRMMEALGAEVILVDQQPGSSPGQVSGEDLKLVEAETKRITAERKAFRADQFNSSSNPRAHYLHTGPEIWIQTSGKVDAFVDFGGSGGTFAGVTKYLKEQNSSIRSYFVEPDGAAIISGQEVSNSGHPIQGGGYCIADLPFLKGVDIDGFLQVKGDEARHCARRLAKEEGIFAGFSSGANVAAALQLLKGPCKGMTIVVIICDSGLKYLSTDLW
eukprot:TRINITY_DN24829_c0_g1_i1.p1 TRINITY_DN24829_c0_g1~~TRINITY_DN24829_c0_g1_i1.p1  ORF type:complete len:328 (+),score=76.13 TRINITY_DN24829_c0_g1_i1:135-1118(+)